MTLNTYMVIIRYFFLPALSFFIFINAFILTDRAFYPFVQCHYLNKEIFFNKNTALKITVNILYTKSNKKRLKFWHGKSILIL